MGNFTVSRLTKVNQISKNFQNKVWKILKFEDEKHEYHKKSH